MKLEDFFTGTGDPFLYYPGFCRRFKISVNACVFLCLIGWKTLKGSDGWSSLNLKDVADLTGLTVKEIRTARTALVEAGLLEEHYIRLDHILRFRFTGADIPENRSEGRWPNADWADANGGHPTNGQMANCPNGVSSNGEEIQKEKIKEDKSRHLPSELDTDEFRSAWQDWIAYRKELRKPLTPSTIKSQLSDLTRFGSARAILSIRQSINKGWQGLFEPKQYENSRNNSKQGVDRNQGIANQDDYQQQYAAKLERDRQRRAKDALATKVVADGNLESPDPGHG